MKNATLECIAPLLDVLRAQPTIREVKPAAFHLNGRDFIHFHEGPEGIFADVLLSKSRVRMPVSTRSEQSELLERIEHNLSSLDSHSRNRRAKKRETWERRLRASGQILVR